MSGCLRTPGRQRACPGCVLSHHRLVAPGEEPVVRPPRFSSPRFPATPPCGFLCDQGAARTARTRDDGTVMTAGPTGFYTAGDSPPAWRSTRKEDGMMQWYPMACPVCGGDLHDDLE